LSNKYLEKIAGLNQVTKIGLIGAAGGGLVGASFTPKDGHTRTGNALKGAAAGGVVGAFLGRYKDVKISKSIAAKKSRIGWSAYTKEDMARQSAKEDAETAIHRSKIEAERAADRASSRSEEARHQLRIRAIRNAQRAGFKNNPAIDPIKGKTHHHINDILSSPLSKPLTWHERNSFHGLGIDPDTLVRKKSNLQIGSREELLEVLRRRHPNIGADQVYPPDILGSEIHRKLPTIRKM
jgi:hypothetical protein